MRRFLLSLAVCAAGCGGVDPSASAVSGRGDASVSDGGVGADGAVPSADANVVDDGGLSGGDGGTGAGDGGGSGADGGGIGGAAVCGDGVVSGDERCDSAIRLYLPGACPSSCPQPSVCSYRGVPVAATGCQAHCVDEKPFSDQAKPPTPFACCPGLASDPSCAAPYPFTHGVDTPNILNNRCDNSLNSGPNMAVHADGLFVPLAPTSCAPLLYTFNTNHPGSPSGFKGAATFELWQPGRDYPGQLKLTMGLYNQAALLLPVTQPGSFSIASWHVDDCGSGGYDSVVSIDVRPLAGIGVGASGTPVRPRIAGDYWGAFVLWEDASSGSNSVWVAPGRYSVAQTQYVHNETWTAAGAPFQLSTAGQAAREPAVAVEIEEAISLVAVHGHIVWIEGDTLKYARLNGSTIESQADVRTVAGIGTPRIDILDSHAAGVVWSEPVGGVRQLRFARIDNSATVATVGAVKPLTSGSGDAIEPAFTARNFGTGAWGAVAWIDTSSGARQLWTQGLDGTTGDLVGPAARASTAAVQPSEPDLVWMTQGWLGQPMVTVLWTDQRDGHAAIYANDVAPAPYAVPSEVRLSPAGEEARGGRFARRPARSNGRWFAVGGGTAAGVAWTAPGSSDTARFARIGLAQSGTYATLTPPVSVACAGITTSAPDLYESLAPGDIYGPAVVPASTVGVWLEGGQLKIGHLPAGIIPAPPY
jgi:hypothetical protein